MLSMMEASKIIRIETKNFKIPLDNLKSKYDMEKYVGKGLYGLILERMLGIYNDSRQEPDFGNWELKMVPLVRNKNNEIIVKETMSITMINSDIINHDFENSHLYKKLENVMIIFRLIEKNGLSFIHDIKKFSIAENIHIYRKIKKDYELLRNIYRKKGIAHIRSKYGEIIQARTKGHKGHKKRRAFYGKKNLIKYILEKSPKI